MNLVEAVRHGDPTDPDTLHELVDAARLVCEVLGERAELHEALCRWLADNPQ